MHVLYYAPRLRKTTYPTPTCLTQSHVKSRRTPLFLSNPLLKCCPLISTIRHPSILWDLLNLRNRFSTTLSLTQTSWCRCTLSTKNKFHKKKLKGASVWIVNCFQFSYHYASVKQVNTKFTVDWMNVMRVWENESVKLKSDLFLKAWILTYKS